MVAPGGDRLLLLHHRDEERWCFPKGHVEAGESLAEAARRELVEETGIPDLVPSEELGEVAYRFFDPGRGVNVHKSTVYFVARTASTRVRPEPLFDDHRWVTLAEARALVPYDSDRQVLDLLASHGDRGSPPKGR